MDNLSKEPSGVGFRGDDGNYYALDFNLMKQARPTLRSGAHFSANGIYTPVEMLSNDKIQGLVGRGIFSVTDTVVIK